MNSLFGGSVHDTRCCRDRVAVGFLCLFFAVALERELLLVSLVDVTQHIAIIVFPSL